MRWWKRSKRTGTDDKVTIHVSGNGVFSIDVEELRRSPQAQAAAKAFQEMQQPKKTKRDAQKLGL